jgi:hypothetical protein
VTQFHFDPAGTGDVGVDESAGVRAGDLAVLVGVRRA